MPDASLLDLMGVPAPVAPAPAVRPVDDHYRTPPEVGRALCSVLDLSAGVHEMCAGDGILAAGLADVIGADRVIATTLHPCGREYHPVASGVDCLTLDRPLARHIVTNPPYGILHGRRLARAGAATAIIRHALGMLDRAGGVGTLACLLDLRFLLSESRNEPGGLLHDHPPSVVLPFQNRVTMYPPLDDLAAPRNPGAQAFAWFVWRPPYRGAYGVVPVSPVLSSKAFVRPDDIHRFDLPVIGRPSTHAL